MPKRDEANLVFMMGFSRLGMVLEGVLLAETRQSKFSVKVVSQEPTWNVYGTNTHGTHLTYLGPSQIQATKVNSTAMNSP